MSVKRYRKFSKAGPAGPAFSLLETLLRLSEDQIAALVAQAVADAGFELVRVKLLGREEKTLQVMAERPDKTMSAQDCARLSRALSPILEEADPISGAYVLEVSSPGLDRPLTRLSDYHDWQGYEVKLELDRLMDGRKRFRGVLGGVDGESVVLDLENSDECVLIPFEQIAQGKLVLTDALVNESLKAAKIAAAEETDHDHLNGEPQ